MLTVEEVAAHHRQSPGTIRARIKDGRLRAQRINRRYRVEWEDVWACERGPMPKGKRRDRYREPLMTKAELASRLKVSKRTIERMIAEGLPTRNLDNSVRVNPEDARDWLATRYEIDLAEDWRRE